MNAWALAALSGPEGPLGRLVDHGLGGLYLILALALFLKYVAPPVPGDLVMLTAVFLVGVRGGSFYAAALSMTLGGFVGALLAYAWAMKFGAVLRRRRWLAPLTGRSEAVLRRWGAWALLVNRFLPGLRTLLFPAAGLLELPIGRVAAAALVGNLLFACLVAEMGLAAGRHFSRLQSIYHFYQLWVCLAVLALVASIAALVVRASLRRMNGDGELGSHLTNHAPRDR